MKIRGNYLIGSFALTLLLLIAFPIISFADEMSGDCGDHLKWNFNENSGVLTISGTGNMYDYDSPYKDDRAPWFEYRETITSIKMENGVTGIGQDAFCGLWSATEVTIPDSVKTIGAYAFDTCERLTEVTIPDGVETIGDEAFFCCWGLSEIVIPDSVTSIGKNSFQCCCNAKSITLSKSLKSIPAHAFERCSSVVEITIPDGIQSIGEYAFWSCKHLADVSIPESVLSIGGNAFSECKCLKSIVLPQSLEILGYGAFSGCYDLSDVHFMGDSLPEIGKGAFSWISLEGNVYLNGARIGVPNAGNSDIINIFINASMPEGWFMDTMNTAAPLPSEQDIIDAGDEKTIVLPKTNEYLADYETAYVNAPDSHGIYVYWDYGTNQRPFYAYHSDPVTILARHGNLSCVLFTTDKNVVHAGWVYTDLLSDTGVEVSELVLDVPMQINGKSLVYHEDIVPFGEKTTISLSYGKDTVDLDERSYFSDDTAYPCYVATYGSDRFVVYYVEQFDITPVVYSDGELKVYSKLDCHISSPENIVSLNKFYRDYYIVALGCHDSSVICTLTSNGSLVADDSYIRFFNTDYIVSKIPLTLNTAQGSISLPAGSIVMPFAVDQSKGQIFMWYNLQEGWIDCAKFPDDSEYRIDGKYASECFDGLYYYG